MIFSKEASNNTSECDNSTNISALCSENAPEMENIYPVTPLLSLTAGVMYSYFLTIFFYFYVSCLDVLLWHYLELLVTC